MISSCLLLCSPSSPNEQIAWLIQLSVWGDRDRQEVGIVRASQPMREGVRAARRGGEDACRSS